MLFYQATHNAMYTFQRVAKLEQAEANNRESSTPPGQASQQCPLQQCEISSLVLQDSQRRTLEVKIPAPKNHHNTLWVVSHPVQPDRVSIRFAGRCACGKPDCPSVEVKSRHLQQVSSGYRLDFEALAARSDSEKPGFVQFLQQYLLPQDWQSLIQARPQKYMLQSKKCSGTGKYRAEIIAVPNIAWEGDMRLAYVVPESVQARQSHQQNRQKGFTRLMSPQNWAINGACTLTIGESSFEFGRSDEKQGEGYFDTFRQTAGKMIPFLQDLIAFKQDEESALVATTITWPQLSLDGNMALLEASDSTTLDIAGKVHLKMDPLIAVDLKTDIVSWIVAVAARPYATFIDRIRRMAAQGQNAGVADVTASIEIFLNIHGHIKGEFGWEKKAEDKWTTLDGTRNTGVEAELSVTLDARAFAEAKNIFVEISIGSELKAKGQGDFEKIGALGNVVAKVDRDGNPVTDGQIVFTGAEITYTHYIEYGARGLKDRKELRSGRRGSIASKTGRKALIQTIEIEKIGKKTEGMIPLFESFSWPETSQLSRSL